jgi:DNA-binding SARP family transcriptional activator
MLSIRILLTAPHRFRRDELAQLIWPDSQNPMNNMRQLLFRMKSMPEEISELIETDREMILVKNPEKILIDLHSFQFPFRCQPPHPPDACPACFADLEHSLSIYRGPFLEGWEISGSEPFDDWALGIRDKMETLALNRLKKVLKHYKNQGDIQKALFHARAMASVNIDQEPFQAELFSSLEEAGCQEEILERFKEIRSRCRELFGIEPDDRIRQIYERAINGKGLITCVPLRKNEPLLEWRPMMYLAIAVSFLSVEDPDEQFGWVERIIEISHTLIEQYGGIPTQHFGTLVVGAFGHPHFREHMSIHALLCALGIRTKIDAIAASGEGLSVCIGIHGEPTIVVDKNTSVSLAENAIKTAISLAETGNHSEILATGQALERTHGHVLSHPVPEDPDGTLFHRIYRVISSIDNRQRFWEIDGESKGPFIVRKTELFRLTEIWERVLQSQCAIFGIRGEKGMGKSRLLCHFLKKIQTEPVLVRTIFCRPETQGAPFFPMADEIRKAFSVGNLLDQKTLEKMLDTVGIRSPYRHRLGKVLSQILEVPLESSGENTPIPKEELYQEAIELFTRFMLLRPDKTPLILAIEDIHWGDPYTLRILKRIGVAPPAAPFLLLFTSRDTADRSGVDFWRVEHVLLEALPSRDIRNLIEAMDPHRQLAPEITETIERDSDGIPLFFEELVRH